MAKPTKKVGKLEQLRPERLGGVKEGIAREAKEREALEREIEEGSSGRAPGGKVVVLTAEKSAVYEVKSETLKKIEAILEENLEDIFYSLTPAEQNMVKQEGEHTAKKIEELFILAKATAMKIFNLIRRWLEFIPGVNKWFLEQEAKIKTDKILKMQNSKSQIPNSK